MDFAKVRDIVLMFVSITAAVTGICALRTWRQELHGKAEYELARRIMRACYEFRNAFRFVRNRAIWNVEYLNGVYKAEEVYTNRWKGLSKSVAELETSLLEGEVIWGCNISPLNISTRKLFKDLQFALQEYLELEHKNTNDQKAVEVRSRFLGKDDGSDGLSRDLDKFISDAQANMMPFLRR